VITDSTTTTIKAVNASQPYGKEAATAFTVTVLTGGGEVLPFSGETATVNVGSATCIVALTPGGSGGSGSCSIGNTALVAGSYTATGTYGGDSDLSASRSAPIPFTVSQATSKITLKLSASSVTYGDEQIEVLAVTVKPEFAGSTPTGTVTVTESATTLCVITLTSAIGSCSLSPDQLAVGTYDLVATYAGDANFRASGSADEVLTVVT
jgi:Bacterial Ig-like domain (group 3)